MTVSLEVERRDAGTLSRTTALTVKLDTAAVATVPVTFGFGPPDSLGAHIAASLGGRSDYVPVLLVGDSATFGSPISLETPGGDDISGVFAPPSPDPRAAVDDGVTGAWLRFDIGSSDGAVITRRSEVFDRLGEVPRMNGTAGSVALATLPVVDGEYVALDTVWEVGLLTGPDLAPGVVADATDDLPSQTGTMAPIDEWLRLYPALYRRYGGDPQWPIILVAGMAPSTGAPDDPGPAVVLDALYVPGAKPADWSAAARDAAAAMEAESSLADLVGMSTRPLGSADSVFAVARAASVPLALFRPGEMPRTAGASEVAIDRMRGVLGEGDAIVVQAMNLGVLGHGPTMWWVVDPTTGLIRDEAESGRHAAFPEYGESNRPVPGWGDRLRRLMCQMAPPLAAVAVILSVTGGGQELGKALVRTVAAQEATRRAGKKAIDIACLGQSGVGPPKP